MTIERITNHVDQGLELLLSQFQGKPRLEAWLRSYLRQVQLLENAIYDVIIKRLIDTAVDAQLDTIGRIVGEERRGRGDEAYRAFIRARILINRSSGKTREFIAIVSTITEMPVLFDEYYPASMAIEFGLILEHDPVLVLAMLRDAKVGGVGLSMVVSTTTSGTQFLWTSVGETDAPGHGFGNVNVEDALGLLSDAVTIR